MFVRLRPFYQIQLNDIFYINDCYLLYKMVVSCYIKWLLFVICYTKNYNIRNIVT